MGLFMKLFLLHLCVLLIVLTSHRVSGHATSNFSIQVTTPDGSTGYNTLANPGETATVYFVLKLTQRATLGNLMLYHQRYVHIQMVSSDKQWALHTHPDDFMDLAHAPLTTSVFYFNTTFPASGGYSIAATFLYTDNNGNILEGVSQTDYVVGGSIPQIIPPLPNYTKGNRFATYAVNDSDIFDDWVHVPENDNITNGYYVELIVGQGSADVNSSTHVGDRRNLNYIVSNLCTYMYVTVYSNDSTGALVNMLPYLASPVHFTIAYQDGAVYHGHGTYVPTGMNFPQIVSEMKGLGMMQMMSMNMATNMMYNLSMNGMMIGVQDNGTFTCSADEGKVMMAMGNMMDMSIYYGPPTFNTIAGTFSFSDGPGQWDIWAYMKFKLPSGEERIIVPHFQVGVFREDVATTSVSMSSSGDVDSESELSASTSGSSQLLVSFFALFFVLVFVF